jgi:hypothetical protein
MGFGADCGGGDGGDCGGDSGGGHAGAYTHHYTADCPGSSTRRKRSRTTGRPSRKPSKLDYIPASILLGKMMIARGCQKTALGIRKTWGKLWGADELKQARTDTSVLREG